MTWKSVRAAVPVGLTAALVLAGTPALAAVPWNPLDLTANAFGATPVLSAPMGYETALIGEGARARVVYQTNLHAIEELVGSPGSPHDDWVRRTVSTTSDAASAPSGYETTGPRPVARVVFRTTAGDIEEFNLSNPFDQWVGNDLSALFGAPPAAGAPFGYTTDLGTGEVARVVYRMADGHIEELNLAPGQSWLHNDLTNIAGAPPAASDPVAYQTDLPDQGPVARVVYRTTDGTVEELSVLPGHPWQAAPLSLIAPGAPPAASAPVGFESNAFFGSPFGSAVARVVYRATNGNVEQLSVLAGGSWTATNLSQNGAPRAASAPFGYPTLLAGQGPAARVVYQGTDGNIWDLKATGLNNWAPNQIAGNPGATIVPFGYQTNLVGENPTARVVYRAGLHIHELSSTVG